MDPMLAGRVVIVTGAGGGIGGASAALLASLGALVVVTDVRADGLPAGMPAVAADLVDVDGARRVVATAVERFGRVDAVVSAAGIYRMASADEQDLDEARRVVEANVLGTINIGVLAMAHMAPGSSIVNFTSGAQWGLRGMAPYAASKGAVASLTYAWALDLADRGIRVNAVSPTAATGMTEVLFDRLGLDDAARAAQRHQMPGADAIAPLVAYLVSTRSAAVTGQVVRLDRGELSIVSHPAVVEPVLSRAAWTVPTIEAAFAEHLRPQPVGRG